mgnify:CR=1 FL=1|jgi:hypothetical protein
MKAGNTHTHLPKRTNVECAVVEKKKKSDIYIFTSKHSRERERDREKEMLSLINTLLVVLVVNIQVEARIGGQRAMIDATSLQSVEGVRHAAEDVLKRFHQEEVCINMYQSVCI